jgi:hypothetical protein
VARSQHFYEEGLRFYSHQAAGTKFVAATGPGLVFPEEYYGEIYYPGISKNIPPGGLHRCIQNGQGDAFEAWRELLGRELKKGVRPDAKNPFRLVYFEEGLLPCRDAVYMIVVEKAQEEMKKRLEQWSGRGQRENYLADMASVLGLYVRSHRIVCVPPGKSRGLESLTLLSSAYWIISRRGVAKSISHGFVLNWPVLIAGGGIAVSAGQFLLN